MTAPELRQGERVEVTVRGEVAHTYGGGIARVRTAVDAAVGGESR